MHHRRKIDGVNTIWMAHRGTGTHVKAIYKLSNIIQSLLIFLQNWKKHRNPMAGVGHA
jgi:hypothetical protein